MVASERHDTSRARFIRDRNGAIAILFGVLAIPLTVATGMAVDYSRAASLRGTLQKAADAASISALKSADRPFGQRKQVAADAVRANVDSGKLGLTRLEVRLELTTSGNLVEVRAAQPSFFGAFLGSRTRPVSARSEAVNGSSGGEAYEVALVLDTTFSMRNDMNALRQAATDFVDLTANTGTRVSIVPYVAAVNPGFDIESPFIDRLGDSRHNGRQLEWMIMAFHRQCTIDPDSYRGGGGGGGGPGRGGREGMRQPIGPTHIFGSVIRELLGISSAHAQTPNTVPPLQYDSHPLPASGGAPPGTRALIPRGFNFHAPCWLQSPSKISLYDLHKRIPNSRFKGCVEARPEPFDVTDAPPTASNPDTLFVPYYWHDEPGNRGEATGFTNNYLDDLPMPGDWRDMGRQDWGYWGNILKVNGSNPADIQEAGPYTLGPNKACPDPLMRLSSDTALLKTRIAGLKHWAGGGTITSEGLMWGWRTLSPHAPFRDGAAYGQKKKAIVLMSDGRNEINQPENLPSTAINSDYTAYGYLGYHHRFPAWNFNAAHAYLDNRLREACRNAKAAGIEIFVVAFQVEDNAASNLLRQCASGNDKFVAAGNQAQLITAFKTIGGQLAGSGIRLAK